MNLYVIYDRVAEESGPIYEAKNDGIAWRFMNKHLERLEVFKTDYLLLQVGTIDHELNHVYPVYPAREIHPTISMVDQQEEMIT